MFVVLAWWSCVLWAAQGAVLDPALYLAPSPPMVPLSDEPPGKLWTQQIRTEREADEFAVLPIEILKTTTYTPFPTPPPAAKRTAKLTTTTTEKESLEGAETFWPSFRSTGRTGYTVGSVHIPLTFSLTGTYGGYGPGAGMVASRYASIPGPSAGVVASRYASILDSSLLGGYGKSGLAGSSYAAYSGATRLYGGNGGAAWSGWGNGKWGHYGKG